MDKFNKAGGGGVEWKRAKMLKPSDDDEPFHLFNQVRAQGRQMLITLVFDPVLATETVR